MTDMTKSSKKFF